MSHKSRIGLMIVAWAAIAAGLWRVWPIQPRLTLQDRGLHVLQGITPDSLSLVALTRRGVNWPDDPEYYRWYTSGPVQVWDLQSGKHQLIPLPFQKTVSRSELLSHDEVVLYDPDPCDVQLPPEPYSTRQGHRVMTLVQSNRKNECWKVEINLDDEHSSPFRLPNADPTPQHTETLMSRTGRWYASGHGPEEELRVIDQQAGTVALDIDASPYSLCFSHDETLFAFTTRKNEDDLVQVWQLQPLKKLHDLRVLAISHDNKLLATDDQVIDIATGQPVLKIRLRKSQQFQNPRFTPDGRYLIAYGYWMGGTSGVPWDHCLIKEVHVWDILTGEARHFLSSDDANDRERDPYFWDPNTCADAWSNPTTPLIIRDNARLLDVRTGESIFEVPTGMTVEFLDDRWIVLQRPVESKPSRLLEWLSDWNVPFLRFPDPFHPKTEMLVHDRQTGQTSEPLPADHYATYYNSIMVSPDGRTLVTTTMPDRLIETHQVWDLPIRRAIAKPLAWSLLFPTVCVLWSLWRRWRTRVRKMP